MAQRDSKIDAVLLASVLLLIGFGIVMVYSASSFYSLKKFNDEFFFLKKQAVFAVAGILILYVFSRIDARFLKYLAYPALIGSVAMLIALFTSLGLTVGGATRWLDLGSFNIQPSEFAKISIILYLAYSMARKGEKMKDFSIGVLPHLIVIGIFFLLIKTEPDFGNALLIGILAFCMLYIGGARLHHLLGIFVLALPLVIYEVIHAGYRMRRLIAFLNPWQDLTGAGFQLVQSFIAFGSGGFWGRGLGNGRQKLFYLPAAHTDFIFSNIGEEVGFIGILFTVMLFVIFAWRGYCAVKSVDDYFLVYLGTGIVMLILIEAAINMCVGLGTLPTKGLTLPFVSYGGSSMIVSCACAGILLNLSSSGGRA